MAPTPVLLPGKSMDRGAWWATYSLWGRKELDMTEEGNGTPCQYSCLENPWTEESGGLQSMGSLESDTTEWLHFQFSLSCIGEGSGTPLQCSCLENPRDGGAWWAAVYGVAQSRTRLKRLSSSSSTLRDWKLRHAFIKACTRPQVSFQDFSTSTANEFQLPDISDLLVVVA